MATKSGGLSYFEEGGGTTTEQAPQTGAMIKPEKQKGPYSMGTVASSVPVSEGILQAMADLYNQKMAEKSGFLESVKDALAVGSPQATLERQKFREQQESNLFNIRAQLAQAAAAQEEQRRFERRRASGELYGNLGAAPQGAADMFGMPPEIRQAISNARNEADATKIYNEWAKKKAEVEANPEFDVPKIPVVMKAPDGSYYRDVISARQLRANPNKYMPTEGTQAAVQSILQPKAPTTEGLRPDEMAPPPAAGAPAPTAPAPTAPAPTAADPYRFENLSPEQIQMANSKGRAMGLQNDVFSRPDAAELFNKQPIEKRKAIFDRLMPEPAPAAPAPAALAPAAPAPAAPAPAAPAPARRPTTAELESEAKVQEQVKIQAESERLKTDKIERDKFVNESEPTRVSERKVRAERVARMVKDDPTIVGVLSDANVKSAIANVIQQGLSTPSGSISVKGLSDAIYQTLPSTISTVKRREIAGYIANMELDAAQAMNGQGQISDGEREIIRAASISIEDPAEVVYKKARMMELRQNTLQKLRSIYGTGDKYTTNFERFKNEPEYKRIAAEYENQLRDIANEEVAFDRSRVGKQKQAPASGTTKSGVPWRVLP